jgi:hypothetical protein
MSSYKIIRESSHRLRCSQEKSSSNHAHDSRSAAEDTGEVGRPGSCTIVNVGGSLCDANAVVSRGRDSAIGRCAVVNIGRSGGGGARGPRGPGSGG